MILAYATILLLALALLFRRDLSGMGRIHYRGGWQVVVLVAALFGLQATIVLYVPGQAGIQMALLMFSQTVLVGLFLLNAHLPGAKLFALGISLNVAVMLANGGWMPITPETYAFVHPDRPVIEQTRPINSKNIVLPRDETNLWPLADIIPLVLPWRRTAVSIGDGLLVAAVAWFIWQTTGKAVPTPVRQPDLTG